MRRSKKLHPRHRWDAEARCPRSVKIVRHRCEHLKQYLATRIARGEEQAHDWGKDGQRWAAHMVVSQLDRQLLKQINALLDRLNALLHEAEMSGGVPIDAIVKLGAELGLEQRFRADPKCGRLGWKDRATVDYQPGAHRAKQLRDLRRRRRL
jgi:hypothetical protein